MISLNKIVASLIISLSLLCSPFVNASAITDVEHHFDADGTGTFTPTRPSPCLIISNEDAIATNSVTVTQTFSNDVSGAFVLRGSKDLVLGCSDTNPMSTKTLAWVPDAGNPDVRIIAWIPVQ